MHVYMCMHHHIASCITSLCGPACVFFFVIYCIQFKYFPSLLYITCMMPDDIVPSSPTPPPPCSLSMFSPGPVLPPPVCPYTPLPLSLSHVRGAAGTNLMPPSVDRVQQSEYNQHPSPTLCPAPALCRHNNRIHSSPSAKFKEYGAGSKEFYFVCNPIISVEFLWVRDMPQIHRTLCLKCEKKNARLKLGAADSDTALETIKTCTRGICERGPPSLLPAAPLVTGHFTHGRRSSYRENVGSIQFFILPEWSSIPDFWTPYRACYFVYTAFM